jgi:hypothetical protein
MVRCYVARYDNGKERIMPDATLQQIMEFFGMPPRVFRTEWADLTDTDKAQLREGIGNGSLTY